MAVAEPEADASSSDLGAPAQADAQRFASFAALPSSRRIAMLESQYSLTDGLDQASKQLVANTGWVERATVF